MTEEEAPAGETEPARDSPHKTATQITTEQLDHPDDGVTAAREHVSPEADTLAQHPSAESSDKPTVDDDTPPQPTRDEPSHASDDLDSLPAISEFSVGLSVDSEESDANSAFGDFDRASSSVSATSSVFHFVQEFGRTYHSYKEGKYYLPNDEQEQNRLDLQHELARRLLGGELYLAPISQPHRVLDIGTGTGIWAIEFAEKHPEADVLGNDLSPIQPEYVPPNCRFEVDDIDDEWVFSHPFDYIHGRYIISFVSDHQRLFRNMYDNLKPGGYVEIMETLMIMEAVDDSLNGHVLHRWNKLMVEGVRKTGKDPLCQVNTKTWMEEAGFVNIHERKIAVPANPWARGEEQKIRGALMMSNLLEVASGITMKILVGVHKWTKEEVEVFLVDVRKGLQDRKLHAYVPV
ncbi:S-adenosyl-L-methionine-dependent methyltransferase [Thozetella sp. PMI_491]|nr:S-adenosyl-L-methionine-dependent methyltransferase [Thozetella sp. PMI_491]